MRTVQFHSKLSVGRIATPTNVISIGCPDGDSLPEFGCEHKRLVRVEFDDVDQHIDDSYVMFDWRLAKRILDFVESCNGEDIVVHCHAGISRSVAVAVFLANEMNYTLDYAGSISRKIDLHNKLVVWELRKALIGF